MLKPKISIKPVVDIVSYLKKIIYKSTFKKTEVAKLFKEIAKNHIFDNYIAFVSIIWINKNKNILEEKINVKSLWFSVNKICKELINIFSHTYLFAIQTKLKNNNYHELKEKYQIEAENIALQIIDVFKDNIVLKSPENLEQIKTSIKSLILFNFIDLYTEKIKIIQNNNNNNNNDDNDEKKYDSLIELIEMQMNYLDESYEMFRNVNSINFNLIFKILVSLRKSII